MDTAAYLNIMVTANNKQALAGLAQTDAALKKTAVTSSAVGKTIAKSMVGIGVAAGAAGVALFKIGQEFDDAYDEIKVKTGATGREMGKLKKSFRDVVGTIPVDFETAATAVANLGQRLDITGKPLTRVAKQMTALSKVTGTDIQENIEATTRLFGDWSIKTRDQSDTMDRLFRLTHETGIEFSTLSRLMVQFGSPLRQLGFNLDEAAVMFARFEREGVNMQTVLPGLRFALKNISLPTEELGKQFKQLGIDTKEPHDALLQIFDVLSKDKISEADQILLASSVFGGRAWADMKAAIEEGRFEFEDMLDVIKNGDATIRGSERQTRDFAESWQLLKNNVMLALEPLARDVFKGVSDAMKDVQKAFKEGGAGAAFDVIVEKLSGVFSVIVEKAGEAAPKIAGALVNGFLNAPILGQLLIGGWFLNKLGGLGAFTNMGNKAGGKFGTGFGKGIQLAASAIAGYLTGKEVVAPMLKASAWEELREELGLTEESMKKVVKVLEKNPGIGFPEAIKQALNPMQDAKVAVAEMENGWTRNMRKMAGVSNKELDRIGDLLREKPRKGAEALDKAMDDIVQSIRQAMKDGEISTRKGSKRIHSVLIDQLGIYGISHGGAQKIIQATEQGGKSLARGGPIDEGRPSGDSVPALLEKGEYVLNRNAVASVGKRSLDALNFSAAKRFAKGGAVGGLDFALGPETVPPIQYDPDHAGGNSHWHVTGTSTSWIVGIGKALQKMGFMVGEHPAFGGVTAQHSATGGHYDALAIDVNSAADETHAETVKVAALLGGKGGLGALGRVKIKLPRFKATAAMFTPGAAGLNNSAAALEKIMGKRAAAASAPAGVAPTGGGALSKAQLVKLWNSTGKGGDANLMAAIALAESGGNPSITNSIGARGLWQIIPSTAAAFGLNYGNLTDPVANAKGAHAILAGQGLGAWEAYTLGMHTKYLQAGGGVPGAPPGFEMGRFGSAHKRLAQLPGMKKRVGRLAKQIAKTDERIQIQQTLAGLPTSPGGAELAGSEKNRQLGLYDRLLEQLMGQRTVARQGFRTSKHFKKNPAFFRDVLVELEGLTGGAGRLLDTKVALAELRATPPAGTGGISIDDLLRIREGATLGLLGGLGNGLAAGGAAPSPSAGPEVNINYANGMEWLRDFVSVQVDGRDRRTNIRSLAGVRR